MQHLRRDFQKPPNITDVKAYDEQWWLWWDALQPEWRTVGTLHFHRSPTGSFDTLIRPGKNGMFLVLLSLCWWADALDTPTEDSSWRGAMNDVLWVLSQLAGSEGKEGKRTLETASPSHRPLKRRK